METEDGQQSVECGWAGHGVVPGQAAGSGSSRHGGSGRAGVRAGGDELEVTLPDSIEIAVLAGDDGIPPPNPRLAERTPRRGPKSQAVVDPRNAARTGLAVTWLQWRGPGAVSFAPQVPEIGEDGRAATRVGFSEPGTYVLQAVADDTVHLVRVNVTVNVKPAPSAP